MGIGVEGKRYFHTPTSMSAKALAQTGEREDGKPLWSIRWDNGNEAMNVCLDDPRDPNEPEGTPFFRPEWRLVE